MNAFDIDHLRTWIGSEQILDDVLTEALAQKYHATFDMAGDAPGPGGIVPRLIHFCLSQPVVPSSGLGRDGHPARGGFLPPVPLPRRMWAGGALTFCGDLRVGDSVRRVSRVDDVTLKEGRTGILCFVTVSHRISVDDALRIEERQDIVYRAIESRASPGKAPSPTEPGQHRRPMTADPRLLFRYSALTFNGHRIHYDRPYATMIEGYPGLVVHGPMQAAFLLNYATELRGAAPVRLSFRGLVPLFDGDDFALHASEDGDRLRLWTAKEGGPICMSANAEW